MIIYEIKIGSILLFITMVRRRILNIIIHLTFTSKFRFVCSYIILKFKYMIHNRHVSYSTCEEFKFSYELYLNNFENIHCNS